MRNYSFSVEEYNKILAHADKTVKEERETINAIKWLINELASYDGKVLNKRIEGHLTIEYSCHYCKRYDHHYLYITRNNFHCEIDLSGYTQEAHFRFKLDYLKTKLQDKIKEYEKHLHEVEHITKYVTIYNQALGWFKDAESKLSNIPGWYSFNRY